jgi:hypothetical protein
MKKRARCLASATVEVSNWRNQLKAQFDDLVTPELDRHGRKPGHPEN